MKNLKIAFIGGGNMARSLISGLIADGYARHDIRVADPDAQQRQSLQQHLDIQTTSSNSDAVSHADVTIFAVKPQIIKVVAQEIAPLLQSQDTLIISIAAGIREHTLNQWLDGQRAIVRTMPNTPALVQCGATALYANAQVTQQQRDQAESIMRAVGMTLWLTDEAQMDAVTALSGSGPAYLFYIMEAMENAGKALGLSQEDARLLTLQTAFGAAKMALESSEDVATLRARVTSPGGTTEKAIAALQQGQLQELFHTALNAAHKRSTELADILGEAPHG